MELVDFSVNSTYRTITANSSDTNRGQLELDAPIEQTARRTTGASVVLFSASAVSGAAIMIYELLAIRVLQRYFGGTIDVWAAEIAVCLGGLAIGYAWGGWLAGRYRTMKLLGIALLAGGLSGLLIHPFARFAGEVSLKTDFAIAWHPLAAAGFSTFLPILALGTILPQAVQFESMRGAGAGVATGRIAAVSTIGSIAGVLATSMGLLPRFGVIEILYGTSIVLSLAGLAILVTPRKWVMAILVAIALVPGTAHGQTRFETYSAYHHILVRDDGGTRSLLFDDAVQSLMSLDDPFGGGFEYTQYFHVPILFNPTMKRALFIGLGGGSGPKSFFRTYPEMQIEVVEIDPQVESVARQYFALPEDARLRVSIADGRAYLNRASGGYGAILMDAYATGPSGPYLPYHMATQEFFQLVWSKLENGGCLFFNAIGRYGGMQDNIIRHLQVTLESVFQASYVFEAKQSVNTLFVAQKIDVARLQPDGTRDGKGWPEGPWMAHPLSGAQLQGLAANMGEEFLAASPGIQERLTQFSRAHSARRRGEVLTDNYAPVDVNPGRRQ